MSKRKRRNSRRRKSSCSSKQSISPHSLQKHIESPLDNVVLEDEMAEKGETDCFCKENIASDEEEKEDESPNNENTFGEGGYGNLFEDNRKKARVTEQAAADKGLKITHSVTIDDFGESTPKIVFQRSHSSAAGETVSSVIAVTTAKVKNLSSNMRLEINEVVQSDDSGIKTTVTVRRKRDKETETCNQNQKHPMSSEEGFTNPYSWNQREGYVCNGKRCENVSYQVSIAELKTDVKDSSGNSSLLNSAEEIHCFKSCCKDHFCRRYDGNHSDTDFTLVDASSTSSSASCYWLPQRRMSLPKSLSNEALWDIPPPREFADKESDAFQDLTENVASCQINDSNVFKEKGDCEQNPGFSWFKQSKCQFSLDEDKRTYKSACYNQLYDLDTQEHLFHRPLAPVSRSSFTKNFIRNCKGKMQMRNNSIAILQTNAQACANMEVPKKRRRTFPGVVYRSRQARESIPSCRESFSSGTLSSFFMQSLPSQAERAARFFLEDERLGLFERESRKSSSSSSYRPSSSSFSGPDSINHNIKAYTTTKNPFYPSKSDDTSEEVFLNNGLEREESCEAEDMIHMDRADQESSSAGLLEQSEVNESGFDEEMIEVEECSPVVLVEDTNLKNLLIHVTPPSPCNSEEHISEGAPNKNNAASYEEVANKRGSVVTIMIGGYEQRFLHTNDSMDKDALQNHPSESPTETSCELLETPGSPVEQVEVIGQDADMEESQQVSCTSITSTSSHSISENPTDLTADDSVSSEIKEGSPTKARKNTRKASLDVGVASNRFRISADARRTVKSFQMDTFTQSSSKCSLEVKEHLKPPGDCVHKDSEETSDHWAKKRKLFKESKQWSSAGGSSMTSQITEESDTMNSEDTRSVDTSLRDIEDRGFYTETFHSASWIYRGDNVNANETVQCLSNRPRSVAVRERTVKINKGMGEYPWGFRIQFSKPIVVTEVDTNGAAEEAGLQVGDYVLAVNCTDVTSVPHSEAADLARQGPDLLTLTIGSDIGRTPNTPRPACRGYLHKRTQSSLLKGWRKRWFVLRHDCCLYYYRNKRDEGKSRALSVIKLEGAVVEADSSLGKPFVFRCSPALGSRDYYFCATSNQEMRRWLEAMERAVHPITQNHVWVDVTCHNASLPPLAVKNPECLGLLHLLDRTKDSWVQHYCILKDACLYFYSSIRSTYAVGGIYLHGYTVREQPLGSKRSTIELKPPSEEFKVFNLCAENPTENKRWIGSIKTSIAKWLLLHQAIQDYMSRPPEETRM